MDFVGELSRRRLLQTASYGVAVTSLALLATPVDAIGGAAKTVVVDEVAERAAPSSRPKMSIRVPSAVEDYASVPITVSVENANFEQSSVELVYLLAQGAPQPELARFYPVANGATVEMSADVCLGQSRQIWAVARLTDGSVCMALADVPA